MLALPRPVYRDQTSPFLSIGEDGAEFELMVDDDDCSTAWISPPDTVHDQDIVLVDAEACQGI